MLHDISKRLHYGHMPNLYLSSTIKPRELQHGDVRTCRHTKTSGQIMSQGGDSMTLD